MNKEKRRIARRKAKPILDQTGNSVVQDAPAERSLTPNQYKGCVRGFASFCISLVIGVSSIAYGWGWYLVVWLLISGVISELVTRGKGVLSTWKMALLDEMPIPEKLVGLSGLLVVSLALLHEWSRTGERCIV